MVEKPNQKSQVRPSHRFTDKAQSARFTNAVRDLGLNDAESTDSFDLAVKKLIAPKKIKQTQD